MLRKVYGCALPASPRHVVLYLTELLDSASSVTVVTLALYGIKHDFQDSTDYAFILNLVGAAKRFAETSVKKKQPVTADIPKNPCAKYSASTDLLVISDFI